MLIGEGQMALPLNVNFYKKQKAYFSGILSASKYLFDKCDWIAKENIYQHLYSLSRKRKKTVFNFLP